MFSLRHRKQTSPPPQKHPVRKPLIYCKAIVDASRDGETTCAAAFEHLKDSDYIATVGSLALCKTSTCACDISGIDGTYPGSGVTGAFSNANGSYKKFQECE